MYAKGKEQLGRNKPLRFSLKPPAGFFSFKRKKIFCPAGPQLAKPSASRSTRYLVIAFTQGFSVAFSCCLLAKLAQLF